MKVWMRALAKMALVVAGLFLLAGLPGIRAYVRPDAMRGLAALAGWEGVAAVLAAGVLLPLAFLPRWPLVVACGLAYGAGPGVLLAMAAGVLGAGCHYWFAAVALSPSERGALVAGARRGGLWLPGAGRPFAAVVALRLFPLSNFSVTNLLCGVLRVPFGTYLCASAVGMLPSTAVYAVAGGGAAGGAGWAAALGAAAVTAAAVFAERFFRGGALQARGGNA